MHVMYIFFGDCIIVVVIEIFLDGKMFYTGIDFDKRLEFVIYTFFLFYTFIS